MLHIAIDKKLIMQSASTILMIKPTGFRFNEETAINNHFQLADNSRSTEQIKSNAINEFNAMVSLLKSKGVTVIVYDHKGVDKLPDAVFPNNWFSTHDNGQVYLYPMNAENRRLERKLEIFDELEFKHNFRISNIVDFTCGENENLFLEGTGSMILDRVNKYIYASISTRTSLKLLKEFAQKISYEVISFKSHHNKSLDSPLIYHTNVMMCLASSFVVICMDAIIDKNERERVSKKLAESKKKIIEISFDQMNSFAGNMLEVQNNMGNKYLMMSSTAYHSLRPEQLNQIQEFVEIIHSPLDTIETLGGGSARCMMAEIFLPKIK